MFSDLTELFNLIGFVLLHGGWVLLAAGLVYMFYKLYLDFIQITWYNKQSWVFLAVSAPKENDKSPLAFEHIFNQLHALHATFTFAEYYIEGQMQIWFTWEVVSFGGVIKNYVKILKKHRDTLEAAIYSQFPEAEVQEAEDYFEKFPKNFRELPEYDIFAFSFKLKPKDESYPLRTYVEYEHATADTFIDPMTGMWEELGKLSPYEMVVLQYIFRPVDDKWKEKGYEIVEKLKGVPRKESSAFGVGVIGAILGPFLDALIRPTPNERKPRKQVDEPPSLMLHRTEGEKDVISAVENKLSKLGYKSKIRFLYIAPKEKYNPSPVYTAVIGAFKALKGTDVNGIGPDTDRWTKVHYWLFREWEKPIVHTRLNFRKQHFWSSIRRRFFLHGIKPYVLNSEEIATLLHFPLTEVAVPRIEKVEVTKVQPPPELPIVP